MELKTAGDPFGAIVGGNELTIYQCPTCKNIEIVRALDDDHAVARALHDSTKR